MSVTRLQAGGDVREDWRTINALIAEAESLRAAADRAEARIAALNRRIPSQGGASGAVRWVEIDGIADLASDKVSVELDGESVDAALPWLLRGGEKPTADHFRMPEYAVGQWVAIVQPTEGTGVTDVVWLVVEEARNWAATLEICDGLYADFVMSATREEP